MLTIQAELFTIVQQQVTLASGRFITGEIHIFTLVKNRLSTIGKKYRNSTFKIGPRKVTRREGYPLCQSLTFSNTWGKHTSTYSESRTCLKKKKSQFEDSH